MQKLMKRLHKNEKGFTLVELMVVVVIIGILVAIAIPVYQGIQANARNSACSANLRTLQGAIAQFYTEVGVYPPIDATPPLPGSDRVIDGHYGLAALWEGYFNGDLVDGNLPATIAPADILRFIEEEPLCPWADTRYHYDTDGLTYYDIVCTGLDPVCGNLGTWTP